MATYSLSALQAFTSGHQTDPLWIGVGVHKRSDHIALLRADSKTMTFTSTASLEAFVAQFRRRNIPVLPDLPTKLAHYASTGLIRPIAIPTAEEEAQRALLRRRYQLVDRIRLCKQCIKGFT